MWVNLKFHKYLIMTVVILLTNDGYVYLYEIAGAGFDPTVY